MLALVMVTAVTIWQLMTTEGLAREKRTEAGHVIRGKGTSFKVTFFDAAEVEKKEVDDTE